MRQSKYVNEYVERDGYSELEIINRKTGEVKTFKLDNEDVAKVKPYLWRPFGDYAAAIVNNGFTNLHRLVMNAPKDKVVDHIHHDRSDTRKSQLAVKSHSENAHNWKHKPKNIQWNANLERWQVLFMIQGKKLSFGLHRTKEAAEAVAKEIRTQILKGESPQGRTLNSDRPNYPAGASGIKGIALSKGYYRVRVSEGSKRKTLGYFKELEEAKRCLAEHFDKLKKIIEG